MNDKRQWHLGELDSTALRRACDGKASFPSRRNAAARALPGRRDEQSHLGRLQVPSL